MIKIENSTSSALKLFQSFLTSGKTPVLDLDGVLFDARQRQAIFNKHDVANGRCTVDQIGQLDLEHYRANSTPEQIAQDKTLPLLKAVELFNKHAIPYHVATARVICSESAKLLAKHNIAPIVLISRQGDKDHRRDSDLKVNGLLAMFDRRQRESMVLIDDSLGNCKAVQEIGLKAIHVPFDGH